MVAKIEPFMVMPGNGELELGRPVDWRYRSEVKAGTCAASGLPLPVRLTLEEAGTGCVPDPARVDAWLAELLRRPQTAESVALRAAAEFGVRAVAEAGPTAAHGVVTVAGAAPE